MKVGPYTRPSAVEVAAGTSTVPRVPSAEDLASSTIWFTPRLCIGAGVSSSTVYSWQLVGGGSWTITSASTTNGHSSNIGPYSQATSSAVAGNTARIVASANVVGKASSAGFSAIFTFASATTTSAYIGCVSLNFASAAPSSATPPTSSVGVYQSAAGGNWALYAKDDAGNIVATANCGAPSTSLGYALQVTRTSTSWILVLRSLGASSGTSGAIGVLGRLEWDDPTDAPTLGASDLGGRVAYCLESAAGSAVALRVGATHYFPAWSP